eukprot:4264877-Pleurochrysis_carterae.AAC.1
MGVQIDGKRVANFAHLSDLNNRARLEMEEALPVGEIFHVNEALEVLEEALDCAEPGAGEIAEVVARMDISTSEEEGADGEGRFAGASPILFAPWCAMALADFAFCSFQKPLGFGGKLVANPASGSVNATNDVLCVLSESEEDVQGLGSGILRQPDRRILTDFGTSPLERHRVEQRLTRE